MTWYPVSADGYTGFVRGDCAYKLSATQEASYLAGKGIPKETPAPTGSIQQTNYVQTTLDYVNLRQTASRDSKSVAKVRTGTVLAFNATTTAGTSTWYRVVYNSTEVWVLGSCVKVMTQAEYQEWLNKNPGAATPQPDAAKGYIVTTRDGVNIRAGHHCAQPLLTYLGVENGATCRASIAFYNDKSDVDALVDGLGKVWEVFHGRD